MGQCVSTSAYEHKRRAISTSRPRHAKEHHRYRRETLINNNNTDKKGYLSVMMKEKRSRLYIIRRCIIMLIFWHRYNKSIWSSFYIYANKFLVNYIVQPFEGYIIFVSLSIYVYIMPFCCLYTMELIDIYLIDLLLLETHMV